MTSSGEVSGDSGSGYYDTTDDDCLGSGGNCQPSTTDTEGLIDDEDYFVTTNVPSQHSGSGDSDYPTTSGSGQEVGSGAVMDGDRSRGRRESELRIKRKRSVTGMAVVGTRQGEEEPRITGREEEVEFQEQHRKGVASVRQKEVEFQEAVRAAVEMKKKFEKMSRKIAQGIPSKFTTSSPTTPPPHPTEHAQYSHRRHIDHTPSEENPAIIYMYKETDVLRVPTSEEMHNV